MRLSSYYLIYFPKTDDTAESRSQSSNACRKEGRLMGVKCGIVGLPNVGKSTLFNALTRSLSAQSENYPFCTISPNIGIVEVPDQRLEKISDLVFPQKTIPAVMELVDIAGLISGASKGEGLGNRFLSQIRQVDAILHVVRAFDNSEIIHVSELVSPASDIETIHNELIFADIETVEKALHREERFSQSGSQAKFSLKQLLIEVYSHLNAGKMIRSMVLTKDQWAKLKPMCFLTIKPTLYIANVNENGMKNNVYLEEIERMASSADSEVLTICAAIEQEISEMEEKESVFFLDEIGFKEPIINRLIRSSYHLLSLKTYFTAGKKEVRAWTIKDGTTAQQAAGMIHTDLEKGFIRAETIAYEDYISYEGEHGAKEAGRLRLEGREYTVQDGDIMNFRFNI